MNKIKTVLKILVFALYFFAFLAVTGKLFFEKQFDKAVLYVKSFGKTDQAQTLVIGYSEPLMSLDPLANDVGSRSRLAHIYEPLIRTLSDLQMEPALAVSYGSVDDFTWEFRLRPGVVFHNSDPLTLDDVIFSLSQARDNEESKVRDIASTIQEMQKIDNQIFRIKTVSPDPLLPSKLSLLFIFQENRAEDSVIGTGSYRLDKNENNTLYLKRFENYWGTKPVFDDAVLKTFGSKQEKINALQANTVDIVANVPPDIATNFNFRGFLIEKKPSLEVNFLMFNFEKIFKDKVLREASVVGLNLDDLIRAARGFAVPSYQFVGNGIFGYDSSIKQRVPNPKKARELIAVASPQGRVSATLDLPKGLEVFGAKLKEQLRDIGVDVELRFSAQTKLSRKILSGQSDFYFFGWRSELGDAYDFLSSVVHSKTQTLGQFNGNNYSNARVDELIEKSNQTMNIPERLALLRETMRIITVEDIIGIPLFSPEMLYGVSKRVKWEPRVDGYILAQEVKM